jgi:hypothetical protein
MATVDELPLQMLPWPILRGPSAATIGRLARQISVFLVGPSLILFVVVLCLSGIDTSIETILFFVALGFLVITALSGLLVGSVWYRAKEFLEVREGYTSLQGGHLDVFQVVPDTNLVMRQPGEVAAENDVYDRLWSEAERERRSKLPSVDFRRLSVPQRLAFTLALAFGATALFVRLFAR